MRKRHGHIQKKILLLLLGGISIGLSGSPKQAFSIVGAVLHDWKEVDQAALRRAIRPLYKSRLIAVQKNNNGTQKLILTERGERWALSYDMENMVIPTPSKWDKKWRIVMFDIPEKRNRDRSILRIQLHSMGFCELQKSVFVHPYPCIDEVEYVTKFYGLGKYVRFVIAEALDNDGMLREQFNI